MPSYNYLLDKKSCPEGQQFYLQVGNAMLLLEVLQWEQSLCGNRLGMSGRCFWEGSLSVKLHINGTDTITIDDHDPRKFQDSLVVIDNKPYKFQGTGVEIYNRTPIPHDVGLYFTVTTVG